MINMKDGICVKIQREGKFSMTVERILRSAIGNSTLRPNHDRGGYTIDTDDKDVTICISDNDSSKGELSYGLGEVENLLLFANADADMMKIFKRVENKLTGKLAKRERLK